MLGHSDKITGRETSSYESRKGEVILSVGGVCSCQ